MNESKNDIEIVIKFSCSSITNVLETWNDYIYAVINIYKW